MLSAGGRNRISPEIALLAGGTAAALGAIDLIYTTRGRIPPVYLLDAVAGAALVAQWLCAPRTPGNAAIRLTGPAVMPGAPLSADLKVGATR